MAVVPAEFTGYFTAAAAAAGVLIGLLFVAVSLRPETIFGESASAAGRAQAGSAFTSLVNTFFIALVALIPEASLGEIAVIMALISLVSIARLHRKVPRQEIQLVLVVLGVGTYVYQLVVGVILIQDPHSRFQIFTIAYLAIASFAVALSRAWALVVGRHLGLAAPDRSGK
jgi:hypothetical protein